MALKKSELYSSIWKSCDELRGGMDATQYKDYVLTLLFVKYVSDRYAGKQDPLIEIPVGGGFADMVALKGKPNIGEGINIIIAKLAEANDLKGVIDQADFNDSDKLGSGKDMQDRLTNLIAIFENEDLNFSKNRAGGDDILGDAYEYLMRHFATESGKSKGQFYTPAEVSRILAKVIGINQSKGRNETIYDPTCGSGSLLLKAADESEHGVTIYGQEKDNVTAALAKMNMILHSNPTAEIWQDNVLSKPHFKNSDGTLKTFDYVVANPPFSDKAWTNGLDPLNDEFDRFKGYGIPPAKNGDYTFLLHLIRSLKSTGKAAMILPHGVLFRGNAEAEIRKNIIRNGFIKGVIGLPPNLFYGTGIPACVIVIDKENAQTRKGIFMINASNGFVKDGNKNRLREQDIHKIVDVFTKQLNIPKYSRMVPHTEIKEKEYNLNIPRYIDSQTEEDVQDIEAHLLGDIPQADVEALESYWAVYPSLKSVLFSSSSRKGYSRLKIPEADIKQTIFSHPGFLTYSKKTQQVFTSWQDKNVPLLRSIEISDKPKQLIHDLAEDLLAKFSNLQLIDKYDVYQHLMTYWNEPMQDDVYLIVTSGWKAEVTAILNKKGKETGWESALIPKPIVINRYFAQDQKTLDELLVKLEETNQAMQDLSEEHSGDEGLLEKVKSDAGNITKGNVTARIREIKHDTNFEDELKIIQEYLALHEKEADYKKQIKSTEEALDRELLARYKTLTEEEVKQLVVEDKWMTSLEQLVKSEMDRISQRLTQRIKELAKRYQSTLPELETEAKELAHKVDGHLKKMGFSW